MSRLKETEAASAQLPDSESFDSSPGATFVTNTLPDISPNAGIVGLCTVPAIRAGMDDLGWHIVDFLAFKALFRGETHHRAQTWLAQCDIASMVQADLGKYAHGGERRLVSEAAVASSVSDARGNSHLREDHINVKLSALELKEEFLNVLSAKSKIAEKTGFPLIIIVCGLTTLEQDVFFGEITADARLTSIDIRRCIGKNVSAIMITPALFSAGWQINPSFCRRPDGTMRAQRLEFFARQFGGVFADEIVPSFEQWTCPILDLDEVDKDAKDDRFPGPVMPSQEQKEKNEALKVKLHCILAGRLSPGHWDHSFSFVENRDDWLKLVGPRNHKPLSYWRDKWEALNIDDGYTMDEEHLYFLGNAFGGNVRSQITHIKYLVAESMVAWPDFWPSKFGGKVAEKFQQFIADPFPEHVRCHEMFNIMEHRATSAILADVTCDYFSLPKPYGQRCRDWRERAWKDEASLDARMAIIKAHGEVTRVIPAVNLPPGVSFNHLSITQRSIEVPASYLSVSLYLCCPESEELQRAVKRVVDFLKEVKNHQVKLLVYDAELARKCIAWLKSINMPTRSLAGALSAINSANMLSAAAEPVTNWPVLQDVEAGTKTSGSRATIPSVGQAAVANPRAPAPVSTDNEAVHHHDDLSSSQSTRTVPTTRQIGALYDHRQGSPAEFLEQLDILTLDDLQTIITSYVVKKAELQEHIQTASPMDVANMQKEVAKLSNSIAFMEAEARLKKHESGKADVSDQPTSVPSPQVSQGASGPNPHSTSTGMHAKTPAKEQKPEQKPAVTPSPQTKAHTGETKHKPVSQQKPKGQLDLYQMWGIAPGAKTRAEGQDKSD